ncbi:hypothetical protein L596_024025 [Steinernema carpocapsae]|uniref:Major facilitator superfamily (MFS) profile domain-containing protein n=1 Tax=Steinernema carpocapsae TaxID=34508 RepID=A0A4U5MFG5_STECR|nr:hypothetical protein L596_024025 [Steinernema carpocapsae]
MGCGEAISAPILGLFSNRHNGVRNTLFVCYMLCVVANCCYLLAKAMPLAARIPLVVISRFTLGMGTGNRGIGQSYVSSVSTLKDRRKAISLLSGGVSIGLSLGPGMQTVINQFPDARFGFWIFELDINNLNIVFAIAVNLICLVILLSLLDEKEESADESELQVFEDCGKFQIDKLAIAICIASRIDRVFISVNFKSIGFLYSEVMFGFTEKETLLVNSDLAAISSMFVVGVYFVCAFTDFLERIGDRFIIICALVVVYIYHLLTMPWPFLPGHLNCENLNSTADAQLHSWCLMTHPINMYLYFVGYVVVNGLVRSYFPSKPCLNFEALPFFDNYISIMFTKLLGPGKHGKMQGFNHSAGCWAKIIGPLVFTYMFDSFGPQPNWALELAFLTALLFCWVLFYNRMSPRRPELQIECGSRLQRSVLWLRNLSTSF